MKIEAYMILRSLDPDKLQKDVNELIGNGFVPFGSLAVVTLPEGVVRYLQPMVKHADGEKG